MTSADDAEHRTVIKFSVNLGEDRHIEILEAA